MCSVFVHFPYGYIRMFVHIQFKLLKKGTYTCTLSVAPVIFAIDGGLQCLDVALLGVVYFACCFYAPCERVP